MASHAQLLVLVGGDSEIPISLDPLPPFEDEVMYLLEEELPPAHYWTQIASHLLRHRRAADAHALLTRGLAAMQRRPAEQQHLHAMLAATHLAAAPAAPKTKLHDARFQLLPPELQTKDVHLKAAAAALELAARANGGDAKAPLQVGALLSRALLAASAGRNDEADRLFEQVLALKGRAEHPVALLGKACCLLRRRAYAPALRLYQQVLSLALAQDARAKQAATEEEAQGDDGAPSSQLKWLPWVGPDPRVGMGLALWGLNRPADARRAWARAAALDPSAAAPALLLGLAALHSAKALEAPLGRDEEAARAALYAEGIANIQRAWASDKNIAMTACALADHIITRASAEAPTRGAAWAKGEFARALKLGEHALQRADSRSAATQAQLLFARAAHLAFALEDPLGSDRVGDVDALELRSSAQRYYGMAIESLSRSAPGEGASSELPAGLALATLSLAQMQVARGESLGAIVALDELLARPGASAKASATLEPALLLACLRAISHPGATALEREADRERARPLLERTLRSIDAARTAVRGARGRDEYDADGETHEEVKEEAATVLARSALAGERLSRKSLEAIAALGDEPLAHVQLAELWQSGTRPNLARAATAYAAALRAATSRTSTTTGGDDAELLVRLRNNIGALHGLRGAEVGDAAQRESILGAAASHLQAALGAARQAEAQLSVPKATFLDAEKTTTLYNLGRILESAGSTAEARQAYEAVLQAHAEYVDAKVRLALLTASVRGGDKEATRAADALLKEALASDPSHFDTRMTYVCFLAGELPASPSPPPWEGIKELIGQLFVGPDGQGPSLFGGAAAAHAIRDQARLDSYTLAALGWTYYHLAHQTKPGPEHRKLRAKAFSRAIELLDRALSADSACAFAAQALAILAAEGVLHELANSAEGEQRRKAGADAALSLLTRVKDVREDGSVQICMGHALMLREDFDASFKMYEAAAYRQGQISGPQVSILQYTARALYALGLRKKSYTHLATSLGHLTEALELLSQRSTPHGATESKYVRYNMAVTRQKALQLLFELPLEARTLTQLEEAVRGVQDAQATFLELTPDARENRLSYITAEVVEQRHQYAETSLLRTAPQHLAEQQEHEERMRTAREQVAARKREIEEEKERVRLEAAARAAEEAESLAEARKQARAQVKVWEAPPEETKAPKVRKSGTGGGGGGGGRKKKKTTDDSSVIATSESEDAGEYDDEGIDDDDDDDDEDAPQETREEKERRRAEKSQRREEKRVRKEQRQKAKAAAAAAAAGGGKKKKKGRKSERARSEEGEGEAAEESDEGPVRKKKKTLRMAREEDLIDSDEEI